MTELHHHFNFIFRYQKHAYHGTRCTESKLNYICIRTLHYFFALVAWSLKMRRRDVYSIFTGTFFEDFFLAHFVIIFVIIVMCTKMVADSSVPSNNIRKPKS